ncbi:MAG: MotA/TolQ/ExbB proton channel family protein [Planctomycetota bacterium]
MTVVLLHWFPIAQAGPSSTTESASSTSGAPAASDGLLDIILSGGIFGLLILLVLFALSISAAYLVFDQVMTLRRKEVIPDGVGDAVRQALWTGRLPEADAACRRSPSGLSVVLLSGLSELEFGWHEVEKSVEESLAEQSARLLRKIEYLSVIGNIAPMVGLLGTVTGMIFAFQQVASTQGSAGAGDLAEGIYQALVTTVGGLIVAIPSLAGYAICRNRVDSLIAEVAHQTVHSLAPIKRRLGQPQRTTRAAVAGTKTGSQPAAGTAPASSAAAGDPPRSSRSRPSPPKN